MLRGWGDSYFATGTKSLGLNDEQVKILKADGDDQLLRFVSDLAHNHSQILSLVQPAGRC